MRCGWVLPVALAITAPAFAEEAHAPPSVLSDVYACAAIADGLQRLACYDHAVGRMQQAQNAGDLVAVDRHSAETIQREAFGFPMPSLPRVFGHVGEQAGAVDAMPLNLASIRVRPDQHAVFTMSNGQVWSQIDTASTGRFRAGAHVTIRRAAFGSYLLSDDRGGAAIRVRRES